MSRAKQSIGTCQFCGRELAKAGMTRHLKSCAKRQQAIVQAEGERKGPVQPLFTLVVEGGSDYWLHLEIGGKATLGDLDDYLRAIWLECCGHLSQFGFDRRGYDELPMDRPVVSFFKPGTEMTHVYDFGTTSRSLVRAVDVREGRPLTKHPITLLARNNMPEEVCAECGAPAAYYNRGILSEDNEWVTFCEEHAKAGQEDDDESLLPLSNSPRMGMCGYDGPATPPY